MLKKLNSLPKKFLIGLGVLVVLLIGARVAMPYVIKSKINSTLRDGLKEYTGQIADFDLALWRGTYYVQGLELRKRTAPVGQNLVAIAEIEVDLSWRALFHRRVLLDVRLLEPQINIYDHAEKENAQNGSEEKNWSTALKAIVPFQLQSLRIVDGSVYFNKTDAQPPVRLSLTHLEGGAQNIGNVLKTVKTELSSTFSFVGTLQDHAKIIVSGRGRFLEDPLAVSFHTDLKDFKIDTLNDFFRAYGYFDLTKGTLSLKGESDITWPSVDLKYNIAVKDLDVVAPKQKFLGVRGFFTELALAFGNLIIRDHNKSIETELLINGTAPNIKVDKWHAINTLVNK